MSAENVQYCTRYIGEQCEREQLRLAQRLIMAGTLASSIAHDINNMLAVIEGSASLAASTLPADSPAQAEIAAIRTASRHGSDLTRRLLSFVRQRTAAPAPLDLGATVTALLPLVERLSAGRSTIAVEIAPGLWPVRADRNQIEQVLLNLAVNAYDAMPDGGRLALGLRNEGDAWVQIEVADTGVGMAEEVVARAFEAFYTTKAIGRGTGLGLFITQQIVADLGGTIGVRSAPGAGTGITILLPRCRL